MTHHYIDDNAVAQRYLDHSLPSQERADFEAHLVDCQECTDRLLLAEMFHVRNGVTEPPAPAEAEPAQPAPLRVRFVEQFKPWQLLVLFAAAALLLLLIPTAYFLWTSPRP